MRREAGERRKEEIDMKSEKGRQQGSVDEERAMGHGRDITGTDGVGLTTAPLKGCYMVGGRSSLFYILNPIIGAE